MGYDMTTATKDPAEAERVDELRTLMYAARSENRMDDADKLYMEMKAAERSYFRLNIWGMGVARDLMNTLGMIDTDPTPERNWPDSKDFGVTDAMWNEWSGEVNENTPESLRAFEAAQQVITDAQREKPTGIPMHKLCSNDGWLVTPDEIAAALKTHGTGIPASAPAWWGDWIGYLRYAQEHGGFRVN